MLFVFFFFFQAEDGIRDAQESRGLGDVYKRQPWGHDGMSLDLMRRNPAADPGINELLIVDALSKACLLYTSDAADDLLCVDLGGRRIIKKKTRTRADHNRRKHKKPQEQHTSVHESRRTGLHVAD